MVDDIKKAMIRKFAKSTARKGSRVATPKQMGGKISGNSNFMSPDKEMEFIRKSYAAAAKDPVASEALKIIRAQRETQQKATMTKSVKKTNVRAAISSPVKIAPANSGNLSRRAAGVQMFKKQFKRGVAGGNRMFRHMRKMF
jgi:hypothetical protein